MLNELKRDRFLIGLSAEKFSEMAAYYMSELNIIHPFREGNGRSIREFIRQLALKCGYIINWPLIGSEALLEATITAAADNNYRPLADCIFEVVENK